MTSLATASPAPPAPPGFPAGRVGASPVAQSAQQSPLPSDATNEDRFRYHLSLELRRHGIEPTPALVETALRTHYANLAAAEADNASGDNKPAAASSTPSAGADSKKASTPTPSFPMDKPFSATSPSSASDSTGAATPPHDPMWNTYINDAPVEQDHGMAETKLCPPQVKQEEMPFGTDNFLTTDMDFESSWGLGMQAPASPLSFDPLATPQFAEPNFSLPGEMSEVPAPPPYNPDPQPVKNEDTAMGEATHLSPSVSTAMTSQPSDATMSSAPNGATGQNGTVDPTSIDPRLVQMTLAEQINLQLQVLQELQAQSAGQQGPVPPQANTSVAPAAAPAATKEESAADLDITLDPIPSRPRMLAGNGREASPGSSNGGNVRGIPASMSALAAADRPSAEQYKALSSKEKRQLRNKISARNFRERRKEYITQLEDLLAQRDAAIETLRGKNATLTEENQRYKALLEQHHIHASGETEVPPAPREASPVVPTTAAPAAPAPEPAAAPAPKQGQYDVGKILEMLRRTQGPSIPRADAPRLSRQSSSNQGLSDMAAPTINLNSTLNISPMSGPSSPMPLTGSPAPRFPEINTKKDLAYPASPRALSRTQSFFAGRPSGSGGSFAAPITQVHSMFAPHLPIAPFEQKTDVMGDLVRSFDLSVAIARAKRSQPETNLSDGAESHVRTLAARAAADCLADVDSDNVQESDGLPSYSQALRAPALYY